VVELEFVVTYTLVNYVTWQFGQQRETIDFDVGTDTPIPYAEARLILPFYFTRAATLHANYDASALEENTTNLEIEHSASPLVSSVTLLASYDALLGTSCQGGAENAPCDSSRPGLCQTSLFCLMGFIGGNLCAANCHYFNDPRNSTGGCKWQLGQVENGYSCSANGDCNSTFCVRSVCSATPAPSPSGLSPGAIVGIVFGVFGFFGGIAAIYCCCCRKKMTGGDDRPGDAPDGGDADGGDGGDGGD